MIHKSGPGKIHEVILVSKRLEFPKDDRTGTNLIVPLRMHFYRFKITLDSLKSVPDVSYVGGNRRWVLLGNVHC